MRRLSASFRKPLLTQLLFLSLLLLFSCHSERSRGTCVFHFAAKTSPERAKIPVKPESGLTQTNQSPSKCVFVPAASLELKENRRSHTLQPENKEVPPQHQRNEDFRSKQVGGGVSADLTNFNQGGVERRPATDIGKPIAGQGIDIRSIPRQLVPFQTSRNNAGADVTIYMRT